MPPSIAGVEDRHQPGMADRGRVPGLALEPGGEPRVGGELLAEHLDGDLAAEHLIVRPPHRRHPAGAQHLGQHVPAAEDPAVRHRHDPPTCCIH